MQVRQLSWFPPWLSWHEDSGSALRLSSWSALWSFVAEPPHPEERSAGPRLEGWGGHCTCGAWFETRRCAPLLTMRQRKSVGSLISARHCQLEAHQAFELAFGLPA